MVHVVRSWCVCFLGDDWHEFSRRTSSVSLACFQLIFLMFLLTSVSLASLRSAVECPLNSRGQVVARPVAKNRSQTSTHYDSLRSLHGFLCHRLRSRVHRECSRSLGFALGNVVVRWANLIGSCVSRSAWTDHVSLQL